jgi:cell division septal protein FtsQ
MAMKMRQSLAQLEQQFLYEAEKDQQRREYLQRKIDARSRKRHAERKRKKGSMRFYVLVLTLVATAVIVAVAMYWTLYQLLS